MFAPIPNESVGAPPRMPIRALNVAEKPSVAKKVSEFLSSRGCSSRPGQSQYNPIYEFKYTIRGTQVDMVMTSVSGHLMSTEFEKEAHKSWTNVDPRELFEAPIKKYVPDASKNIFTTLQREAKRCAWLILWLDCDREGENIAFEVIDACLQVKRLEIYRARFSALIERDIKQACQTLVEPNRNQAMAVDARSEIDLRIGAVFTRFQTLRIQNKFVDLQDNVISYGPCQFPTLGFVVDAYKKHHDFKAEPFWYLEMHYKDRQETACFSWGRQRVYDRLACLIMLEICLENPEATVTDVKTQRTARRRPCPLETVEFQQRVSRFLHLNSSTAMDVAEKLYQKGFISYPRTETNHFKEGTDLRGLIDNLRNHPQLGQYATGLLNDDKFEQPVNGGKDDNAHPPIHPTALPNEDLDGNELKVYEFVVRHFLACCSRDAVGSQTTIEATVATEVFTTRGLHISERNYLEVYTYDRWQARTIPQFLPHQTFMPDEICMVQGSTTAPPLLTESDLIGRMNKKGIGTDATIAQHIKTIQERKYAEVVGRTFRPTPLGLALVDGYQEMKLRLAEPVLRAKMEQDMTAIAEGKKSKDEVVQGIIRQMRTIFDQVIQKAGVLDNNIARHFARLGQGQGGEVIQANFSACQCGALMDLKSENGARFLYCTRCLSSHTLPKRGELTAYDFNCRYCNFQVLVSRSELGKEHKLCPKCFKDPPAQEVEKLGLIDSFRCLSCSNLACKLSGRGVDVAQCPSCPNARLFFKRYDAVNGTSSTTWVLECKDCRLTAYCNGIKRIEMQGACESCERRRKPARKVIIHFKRSAVPPTVPSVYPSCFGCDQDLDDILEHRKQFRDRKHRAGGGPGQPAGMARQQHAQPHRTENQASQPGRYNNNQSNQIHQQQAQPRQRQHIQPSYSASFPSASSSSSSSSSSTSSSSSSSSALAEPSPLCPYCKQPGHLWSRCEARLNAEEKEKKSKPKTTTFTRAKRGASRGGRGGRGSGGRKKRE
eukprot:g1099.t1